MKISVLVTRLYCLTKIALGTKFERLGMSKSSIILRGLFSSCPSSLAHLLELVDPLSDKVPKPDSEHAGE